MFSDRHGRGRIESRRNRAHQIGARREIIRSSIRKAHPARQTDGELSADADAAVLARVASAILHSLALRLRAGDSRASLRATAAEGMALICGARNQTAPKAASMTGTRKRFEK
ncbi:hypothetical protein [Paraburkholderia sp. XV]|uniref:hypothetical protein n=1 Tax=Paraburkholderia sp. XV TaxID=2831520 RepID=UPI001CD51460|nr:hypothetical protein [Paraburkholderia sp. XV]